MSQTPKITPACIDGILLIDKPLGLSSNAVLQRVKRLLGAKKAGHTGSLDPLATGMLPICFGEATKFSHYLLDADKTYEASGLLGATSNTGDAEGDITPCVERVDISYEALMDVLPGFTGDIQQVPPCILRSSTKVSLCMTTQDAAKIFQDLHEIYIFMNCGVVGLMGIPWISRLRAAKGLIFVR